jgi:hypothetical protein
MAQKGRRSARFKWKHMGFIPRGWDDLRAIKYGDPGFLYLCRQLRDDWRQVRDYCVRDLKFRPGQGGRNVSYDWTGLDDALVNPGAKVEPPRTTAPVRVRKLNPEERESFGQEAHRHWVAVRTQQLALGEAVSEEELIAWDNLPKDKKQLFSRSGESLAMPDYVMLETAAALRKNMGEKAFRRKMFEICVSVAFERMLPEWTEAQRYHAHDMIVKLSEMLDVPTAAEANTGQRTPESGGDR